jgi:RHS repeat-associated protein
VHPDHLDTPRVIVNAANQTVWRWDSAPYGDTAAEENPNALGEFSYSLRLPGQQYDGASGQHYNYFRDYEAATGRYVQSDPIGLCGGIALFAYVDSSPLSFWDPDGQAKRGPRPKDQGGAHNEKIGELAQCVRDAGGEILSGGNEKKWNACTKPRMERSRQGAPISSIRCQAVIRARST